VLSVGWFSVSLCSLRYGELDDKPFVVLNVDNVGAALCSRYGELGDKALFVLDVGKFSGSIK
jgi:hypothetical protein